MRKLNRPYLIGIIIIVLVLGLLILVDKGRCNDLTNAIPVVSKQYGTLTYIIAIEKECDGVSVPAGAAQWMPRLVAGCKTKYYHLIGPTNGKPALVSITERMPTEESMRKMLRKYLMTITQGGM